ncbi:Protein RecA [Streptomyces californicus]
MGDSHVGLQARLMSQALRKITSALNQSKTTAIFINQLREKIGVMFGSPETTTGGRALEFLRLGAPRHPPDRDAQGRHRRGRQPHPRQGRQEQGRAAVQAGGVRHPLRPGHQPRGRPDRHGRGARFVRKAGAWYTYEGDQLGQGKENARNFLKDNPDLANEIEEKILEKLGVGAPPGRRGGSPAGGQRRHRAAEGAAKPGDRCGQPRPRRPRPRRPRARRDTSYGVAGRPGRSGPGAAPECRVPERRAPDRRAPERRSPRNGGCRRTRSTGTPASGEPTRRVRLRSGCHGLSAYPLPLPVLRALGLLHDGAPGRDPAEPARCAAEAGSPRGTETAWAVPDSLSTSWTWFCPKARPWPVASSLVRSTPSFSSSVRQPSMGSRTASECSVRAPAAVVNAPNESAWSCQPVPVPGGQPISHASLPPGPSAGSRCALPGRGGARR